ncbi:MAG TPA: TlpA disulfide reductase family protein [Burkholderiales bacterium]|nr:TlpA disulfide reductase family protein [Burkholderiales bacterium]
MIEFVRRRSVAWFVVGAVMALGAAAFAWRERPHPMPVVTFNTLSQGAFSAEALRGKVTLVTFWATSCTICLSEMPQLVELYQHYRERGFELIGVAMPYDAAWLVADYSVKKALPFPVALDPQGDAVAAFGVAGTPTAFLIDKRGVVLQRIEGRPDFDRLSRKIERALAG